MELRMIKTKADYKAGMATLHRLMDRDPEPGTPDSDKLEVLALLLEQYEAQHFPMDIPDPVQAIRFRMEQQGLTNKDLVPMLGSMSRVSEVLNYKRPLSLTMMRKLHDELEIPAEVLLQESGRDQLPEENGEDYRKYPLKQMQELGYFEVSDYSLANLKIYAEDLVSGFFQRVNEPALAALFRHANNQSCAHQRSKRDLDELALKAWCGRVMERAKQEADIGDYRPGIVDTEGEFLRKLARLSSFEDGPLLAKEYLNRNGIHLVIEPHLPKTYLDGAALLLCDGRPVVGMTLRYDRIDNFWFVLMHELAHIALHLHGDQNVFVDDLDNESDLECEREADWLAQESLLPQSVLEASAALKELTAKAVLELARELEIHPSIIVGRIQREKNNYRLFNRSLGRGQGEVAKLF
jgi:HTH-type transcriptional regulator/antitoxin HigA